MSLQRLSLQLLSLLLTQKGCQSSFDKSTLSHPEVEGCDVDRAQVRGYACDCSFPEDCDSQLQCLPPTRALAACTPALSAQPKTPVDAMSLAAKSHEAERSLEAPKDGSPDGAVKQQQQQQQLPTPGEGAVANTAGDDCNEQQNLAVSVDSAEVEARCQQLEDRFVNDVYNTIAPHFNATRRDMPSLDESPQGSHMTESRTCKSDIMK